MKFQTKRVLQRVLCLVCTMFILLGASEDAKILVHAAEAADETERKVDILQAELMEYVNVKNANARTTFLNCEISISCSEEGLHIEITTGTVGIASVIGVKDIKIMKKVWYGWKTIATGSGGELYDRMLMGLSIDYSNVEVGETYRITCVHYGTVDVYEEAENDTGGFVFQY